MDGAIRSRKKRDRRDVLPDDAGAVAVLINEILRDLAGINHFAVLQRDDILRVGIAGDPVCAGEGSALTGEEVLLSTPDKTVSPSENPFRCCPNCRIPLISAWDRFSGKTSRRFANT